MPRHRAVLCLLLLLPPLAAAAVPLPQFDLTLVLGTNDNAGQAERDRDIVDDEFAEISAGAGYRVPILGGRADGFARGFVVGEAFNDIDGLGHVGGGLELGLEGRLNDSALPPFYRLLLSAEAENYDFEQRDSTVYTAGLTLGASLGPRATLSIGGEYRDRQARSDVFDLQEWSGFLEASYLASDTWQIAARATYVDGDVWSTVQAVSPTGESVNDIFDLIAAAEVIQRDDAFNDAFDGHWFVYRLPATSGEYSLSASKSFGERTTIGFEWIEIRVHGDRDNDYDNRVLQLSFAMKF